jgi:acyl-CoA synthetase (AMP-forming)/AMP-acid ligase II
VGDVLDVVVAQDPQREAVVGSDARLTYAELDQAADRAARYLWELGLRGGDVVGVSLPNTAHIVVLFHGVMRLGAIFLGVNRNLAPPEKSFILDDAGARFLITDSASAETLKGGVGVPVIVASGLASSAGTYPRAVCDLDEAAGLAYTSGTTGRPKGVVHSHRNLLLPGAVMVAERDYGPELRKGDCTALTILNLQVTSTLLVAQAGGTQIVMDRLDPVGIAAWIRQEAINSWFGVPTMLHGLATSPEVEVQDLASLVDIWTGGSHCPVPVRQAFESRFGHQVHATYGMTEVPTIVTIEPRGEPAVPGSSGRSLPHLVIEIVDDAGAVLPPGRTGEITVRAQPDGPWGGVYRPMLEYLHRPEATGETVRDGVLYTGDLGELDDQGNLLVRDRRHSLILRGGANIYPAEVERVLNEIHGVAGVAVVGVPDLRLGQRVVAAVEVAPGVDLTAEQLDAYCRANLARYKVPEEWRLVTLPRNAMGKVIQSEVKRLFV